MSVAHIETSIAEKNLTEEAQAGTELKLRLLEAQLTAVSGRQDFQDDCMAEMADAVYA